MDPNVPKGNILNEIYTQVGLHVGILELLGIRIWKYTCEIDDSERVLQMEDALAGSGASICHPSASGVSGRGCYATGLCAAKR